MKSAAEVFTKLDIELRPDPTRTVIRPFSFGYPDAFSQARPPRAEAVVDRIRGLDDAMRSRMLGLLLSPMRERHRNAEDVLLRRFGDVHAEMGSGTFNHTEQLLIGAYFIQEYAFESAALFNPSIVALPDEAPTTEGAVRFVMSLRGIGEGHISSVTLRTGEWELDNRLVLDPSSSHGVPPRIECHDDEWVRLVCEDSQDASETVIFPVLPSHVRESRTCVWSTSPIMTA